MRKAVTNLLKKSLKRDCTENNWQNFLAAQLLYTTSSIQNQKKSLVQSQIISNQIMASTLALVWCLSIYIFLF